MKKCPQPACDAPFELRLKGRSVACFSSMENALIFIKENRLRYGSSNHQLVDTVTDKTIPTVLLIK